MSTYAHMEYYLVPTPSGEIIGHSRNWSMFVGGLLIALGILALAFPFAATLAAELVFGVLLTVAGIGQLIHAFRMQGWKGSTLAGIGGLLSLLIGGLLLMFPLPGILTLTLLIGAFFVAGGIFRAVLAFQLKPHDGWGWLLFSAILALLLGGIILTQWPQASLWVIGILISIDFIFTGWWMLLLGMASRRLSR